MDCIPVARIKRARFFWIVVFLFNVVINRNKRLLLGRLVNNGNRYKKVNLKSYFRHGTVEFRQHSGTIEYTKISNWVLFLHSLVAYNQKGKLVDKNNPLTSIKKITKDENYNYLTNRIAALAA